VISDWLVRMQELCPTARINTTAVSYVFAQCARRDRRLRLPMAHATMRHLCLLGHGTARRAVGSKELTILSSASAGALLTLSKAVVGDARLRLPGPQLVRGVSKDVTNDEVMFTRGTL